MSSKVRHFSPAETAERLGVTVKALRVYERRGMVTPLRTAAGWRAYGPDQIARLHQILALKSLGLPLARIAELLAGKPVALDGLLAAQEQALAVQCQRLDRALSLLRAARAKLKAGDALSIDDLTTLTKETTMNDPMTDQEVKALFEPLSQKHFTAKDLAALRARNWGEADQAAAGAAWAKMIEECKALMARGADPACEEAKDLAGRWQAQVDKFSQGDPALEQKSAALWKEAMADPRAPRLPIKPEIFAFVGKAIAARKAALG